MTQGSPSAPPTLRPHQIRSLNALRAAYAQGHRRVLIVMPTGAGKTFTAAALANGYHAKGSGRRSAWFAHRRELVSQAVASLRASGVQADRFPADSPCSVVSVSAALRREEVPAAGLVVLDECHHFAAEEWKRLPAMYDRDTLIVGLTATPERGDGKPLKHIFEHLIVGAQPAELASLGLLVPCEIFRPRKLLGSGEIAQTPVRAYLDAGLRGKKNVVFAPHVKAATEFAAQFAGEGIVAHVVHGEMGGEDRDRRLADFRSGRVSVIVNVFVLTEGWDAPEVEVITLARRCGSQGTYLQMVGRGLRPAEGKTSCALLDLCGVSHALGDPLEDREYSLDGECGIGRKGASTSFCRVCGTQLPPGSAVCPGCARPAEELATPESIGEKLEKFAVIRRDGDAQRAMRLAKWIHEAEGRGIKWQSALYRYKGAYGENPSAGLISHALAITKGKPWCSVCKSSRCECQPATVS